MKKMTLGIAVLHLIGSFAFSAKAVDISFKGDLTDYPCKIDTGSDNQTVHFLKYPVKNFHINPGNTPPQKFSIRLRDCDANSSWKIVKFRFSGNKESQMKERSDYFLSVTGSGNEGKLAIGLLDTDGKTPLKLGESHNHSNGTPLTDGSMNFNFFAFTQATPDAISNKSVQPGEYESLVKFELTYE
ncbi:fimbrial protein [Citrobacter portucalensis]|uniref:fimbrial protein n=1 Tax=Citrobacter portucalensis TaxID=1639133 RepID=UPI00237A24B7|nr:fimbrial protein [Citrobacter portucalensis]MDQ9159045.1 fimbrial protein [Citrobacter portucalensis]